MQANNGLFMLGWEDIRFTVQESGKLAMMAERKQLSRESLAILHQETDGWAAGLILYLRMNQFGGMERFTHADGHRYLQQVPFRP